MGYHQINLQQIEYFLAVAKHLNFTEAAKSVYVSQPSLSKQIAILEREIDVKLFARTKRSVRLTTAGEGLYNDLKEIHHSIELAIERAKGNNTETEGIINIGCLEAMNTDIFLSNAMDYFQSLYPNIKIIIEKHHFKTLREKMINGTLDLIFTLSFELDASLELESRVVYETNSCIVLSAKHPKANLDQARLSDFKDDNFVVISREESPQGFDAVISLCKKNGFVPKIIKHLPNAESLLLCVEVGLGVTVMDGNVRMFNNQRIKQITLPDDFISVMGVWKKGNTNPAVQLFVETML